MRDMKKENLSKVLNSFLIKSFFCFVCWPHYAKARNYWHRQKFSKKHLTQMRR